MQVEAILTPTPEGGFTAFDPGTGTALQGETVEEATANLREAVALYLEAFPPEPADPPLVRQSR